MDTDGTVSEVKVAHTGDPEVGYKFRSSFTCKKLGMILILSDVFRLLKFYTLKLFIVVA